jgi:hypothetical protein
MFLLVVLLPVLGYLIWKEQRAQETARYIRELRERGLPASFDDLDSFYRLPAGVQDTTEQWRIGVAPLVDPASQKTAQGVPYLGPTRPPPLGQPWPDIDRSVEFLDQHAGSMENFREATRLGGAARFPIDFQLGPNALLADIQNQRAVARFLALDVRVAAHRQDVDRCAESIRGLFAVEESLRRVPFMVAFLVNVAVRSMALDAVADTIGGVRFSEEQLREFQSEIRSSAARQGLTDAIAGERLLVHHNLSQIPNPFWDPDAVFRPFAELQAAAELDFPQAIAAATRARANFAGGSGGPFNMNAILATALPGIEAGFSATARTLANERACDAAISVVLYHRRHGRLPDKLDDLTPNLIPTVPVDPFDGQPLRFRHVEGGFVIYSVGADQKDDGGDPHLEPARDEVIWIRMLPATEPARNPPPGSEPNT